MDNRTIVISFGLFFELIGGIMLASEMIGLLDKIRNWNLSLQGTIQSRKIELLEIGLYAGLLYLIVDVIKKFNLKIILSIFISILFLYILIFINLLNNELLRFLEYLTEKLGTESVLGILGVLFLCLGFLFQFYINLTIS